MRTLDKQVFGPGDETFDGLVRGAAVWGIALYVGETLNSLLTDILPRSWRMSLSLVVILVLAFALMQAYELWPVSVASCVLGAIP